MTAETLSRHLNVGASLLPSLVIAPEVPQSTRSGTGNREDIDMLFKMVFKLREEVEDLKEAVMRVVNPSTPTIKSLPESVRTYDTPGTEDYFVVQDSYSGGHEAEEAEEAPAEIHALEESLSLDKKRKELIIRALRKHGNNRKKAAEELGISERTLYRNLNKYGISKKNPE